MPALFPPPATLWFANDALITNNNICFKNFLPKHSFFVNARLYSIFHFLTALLRNDFHSFLFATHWNGFCLHFVACVCCTRATQHSFTSSNVGVRFHRNKSSFRCVFFFPTVVPTQSLWFFSFQVSLASAKWYFPL